MFNRKFYTERGSTSRKMLLVEPLNYLSVNFLIAQEEGNCSNHTYGFSKYHELKLVSRHNWAGHGERKKIDIAPYIMGE